MKGWRERQQDAEDRRSEAWVVSFFLRLYISNSFSLIDVESYIPRIRSTKNRKLVDAMLGKNVEPDILARLRNLVNGVKESRKRR